MITVVAAVIEDDGRFLLTRRQPGKHLAGMWEFPGGKVDERESHREALAREIREELDAGVEIAELMLETTHDYPEVSVALFFYRCTLTGPPRALLGQEMQWVPRADLGALGFPEADRALIDQLTGSDAR